MTESVNPSDIVARLRGANSDRITPIDALRLHDENPGTFPLSPEDVEGVLDIVDEAADIIEAQSKALAEAREYAARLLVSFVTEHCNPVPEWAPLPDLMGVLTQLDNATTITRDMKAALRNALPAYENWMDGHADDVKSATCRQLTFGEIRAAYLLLGDRTPTPENPNG